MLEFQATERGKGAVGVMDKFTHRVIDPEESIKLLHSLTNPTWVYHYEHIDEPWILSISTQAPANSEAFSLGGFRIVPKDRAEALGYNNDREALDLANLMDKKVSWSRLFGIGGPLAKPHLDKIVGGKCVLLPTEEARMGNRRDSELLDFAISCMRHFELTYGIFLTTGQDLGHATMSDGKTYSCDYLNERFDSSITADTSKPTGAGNFAILKGLMRATGFKFNNSSVGLIGCGNIGEHILSRLLEDGAQVSVVELDEAKLARLQQRGVTTYTPKQIDTFFQENLHGLVINANGGTLDEKTITAIVNNPTLKVITGCENLMMRDPQGVEKLAAAGKLYCPPEICGMMGYLAAQEERVAVLQNKSFDMESLFEAAKPLEKVGLKVGKKIINSSQPLTFVQAADQLYNL